MNKIPTIFVRDMSKQPALVTPVWVEGCEWVRDGEGRATVKWDGTCCLVRGGNLYKRRELRPGDTSPTAFESLGTDENTGKTVGWVPVNDGSEDRWHREGYDFVRNRDGVVPDGTYELMGPKVQGNKSKWEMHILIPHGEPECSGAPRTFNELRDWLAASDLEGVVWHHDDGRMAKIKKRDFGLRW